MNLVDRQAKPAQAALLDVVHQNPDSTLQEVRRLILPAHHAVLAADVNLTRLGAVLAVAYEKDFHDFAELLLLEKLGPRTCRPCRWLPKSYMEGPHVFPILRGSALFWAAKTAIRSRSLSKLMMKLLPFFDRRWTRLRSASPRKQADLKGFTDLSALLSGVASPKQTSKQL